MVKEEWDIEDTAELESMNTDELPQLVEPVAANLQSGDTGADEGVDRGVDRKVDREVDREVDDNPGFDPYNNP